MPIVTKRVSDARGLAARNGSGKEYSGVRALVFLQEILFIRVRARREVGLELSDVSNQMPFTRYEDVPPRWKLSCECATAGSNNALIV